ncbi:non-ribosomal peptide synthetase [Brevibacillus porteri]|uniref:Non-ribosomal peptide synthetase n=1 Tax=Brevibacillus porteri TaxID=2126350 RepID=A0ABX5FJP3_9BACL|nr:non-ribosomal peptide synthetase [Brevibacillus porteri]MED1801252.1 non-ribosomal peptide synthetase [Brevibacillus porteri]MED2129881.1 non-ribosomal peptide synthetase [Brevibacillus porteri]MED2746810.1 non-ribosomal peptide synthetase [Brevibacillus porteri]MED2815960.1 non-ribosomal peptide synthetase [Brevibacillus porteri]MED2895777.1 non-ribosomal peptide synthetase [Brevibacillus porteri]
MQDSITALLEEQVELHPDAIALVYKDASLTYKELNSRANRLAHYLKSCGVGAESRVGLYMDRSFEMIISMVAILKAGGAYVPLDPAYPEQRLLYMLQDASISIVLTQESLKSRLPDGMKIVCPDLDASKINKESDANVGESTTSESLAYLMYTSGSTGNPKGVLIPHRGVIRLTKHASYVSLTPEETILQLASISFDAATFEIWGSLLNGARLVIYPFHGLSLDELGQVLRDEKISTLWLTAGIFHQMIDYRIEDLRGVRQLLTGGDIVSAKHAQRALDMLPETLVINGYGPTENTTFTCYYPIKEKSEIQHSVPIGRPINDTEVFILNDKQKLVPVGLVGELYVGGKGLAFGYWNRPELNQEKFIPHPFQQDPEARLYRTGDLVKYVPGRGIEFIGRKDNQVKIRGNRIELGEIVAVLNQHESVREAVVLVHEYGSDDKRLIAYITGDGDVDESKRYANEQLPPFMVPSYFVKMDAFPLTANGKVDRQALPLPEMRTMRDEFVAPRTGTENRIAEIWYEILKVERLSIHDSFFDLGGHSLLATQVISRLQDAFHLSIPLRILFECPTIASLDAKIMELGRDGKRERTPAIARVSHRDKLPLSHAQQRLWFLHQLEPESTAYNVPHMWRLTGQWNVRALETGWNALLQRHDILRTVFPNEGGQPFQAIEPYVYQTLPVIDLRDRPASEKEEQIHDYIKQEADTRFDLQRGPLIQVKLIVVEEDQFLLLCTMHHVITDGWSEDILLEEWLAFYEEAESGARAELPELSIQYADFSVWQREWLTDEVMSQQLDYWKAELSGELPALQLPIDRPRPSIQTYAGDMHKIVLASELLEKLKAFSRQENTTLFMTLMAAYQGFLSRYTGQNDILVGSPIANRNVKEIEGLIGFFVNTLVYRANLQDNPTFKQLLAQVKEKALQAQEYQDVPFEKIVEMLQLERNTSYSPAFQTVFTWAEMTADVYRTSSGQLEKMPVQINVAKFDLQLSMGESEDGLVMNMIYNTDLFDPSTIEKMTARFAHWLQELVNTPDVPIALLELLTEEERHKLLLEWNHISGDFGKNDGATVFMQDSISTLFEEQVELHPDATALAYKGTSLSYRELNSRANQLAHYLKSCGVGADSRVGLYMDRSFEMIISMVAILKAGGAYVPLDPAYPEQRLLYMLQDASISIVLTQESLMSRLPDGLKIVCPDLQAREINKESDTNLGESTTSESLAYLMYTSGSTGNPKGVLIPHRGVIRLTKHASYVSLTPEETMLQLASISFDAATFEIWGSLLNGAKLVIYPFHGLSLEELGQVLRDEEISTLWLTAGVFHQMIDYRIEYLKGVRQLLAGGDIVSAKHAQRALDMLPDTLVINGYGPTENTTFTCYYPIKNKSEIQHSVPIGRPINDTEVYILSEMLKVVPDGLVGELYVGGKGLAFGYWNRTEMSQEKFIPHPFQQDSEARLYRTGDLVKYVPGRGIEFIGRKDNQVKIRGNRIELGEIVAVLSHHESVRDAVVLIHEYGADDKRLIAYIAGDGDVDEWKRYASEQLPSFMVPSYFVKMDVFPLTANGKVDRQALPLPEMRTMKDEFVAPRTGTENRIAEIWREVLKTETERLSIHDSFFDLGGHSLLATQVISRLQEAFHLSIPLRILFECPTIASLDAKMMELGRDGKKERTPAIVKASHLEKLPLSHAQQRLWFLHQLEPESTAYNVPHMWRLTGQWNAQALEMGWNALLQRHDILRTVFSNEGGQPFQVIEPHVSRTLPVTDLRDRPAAEKEEQIHDIIMQEADRRFDLQRGPLIQAKLIVVEEDQFLLLCTMHHVITDGWSEDILLEEWLAFYEEVESGTRTELRELPIQYADFAVWQREWLTDEVMGRQLDYWKAELSGELPVLQLPIDRPRPSIQTYAGSMHKMVLTSELLEKLKAFSRQENTTLFMTLMAAYQGFLSRYTGQTDILVGSPIANRHVKEIEGLIGFFVNTLVYRTNFQDNSTFQQLLAQVKEKALQAQEYQDVPFEKIVEMLQLERNTSYSPVFQTVFTWAEMTADVYHSFSGQLEKMPVQINVAKFDLQLSMGESEDGLVMNMIYNTDLFDASTIEKMTEYFANWLQELVNAPDVPMALLELLSEKERHKILVEWNDTAVAIPENTCLHDLFIEQAKKTPELIAAEYGSEKMTYQELDRRSNQLAHYLIMLGVGPNTPVGICMNRSIELVISILGIVKAGGAFLPLDTEMPQTRMAKLLESSKTNICISEPEFMNLFGQATHVRCIDSQAEKEKIASMPEGLPEQTVKPTDLVSIYYTSGSTGNPKGVENLHYGWVNRMLWMQRQHGLGQGESVLQKTTLTFDDAAVEFFWPLSVGGRISLLEPWLHRDPEAIIQAAIHYQVACIQFVPSMLNMFVDALTPEDASNLHKLKNVISSGEALLPETVGKFFKKLNAKLHNTWGATEVSIDSTIYTCSPMDVLEKDCVSVGKPIDNNRVYVLDQNRKAVPIGVIGDLYIGGLGLARGYLHNSEKTQEVFMENPFVPGERIYRTGDKGYFLPSGNIKFVGRQDNQIKIRGMRVELGEIESTLSRHPSVREAAVISVKNDRSATELAAYIVGDGDVNEWRAFLKEHLPAYMIPTYFMKLDSIPKTTSGKIDRNLLELPVMKPSDFSIIEPRTIPEELIHSIWCDILQLDRISIKDSFFDRGGHSLLATQVISRMRNVLGMDIPLRTIFEFPTIEAIAARISEIKQGSETNTRIHEVSRVENQTDVSLFEVSHGQRRQWFHAKFSDQEAVGGVYLFEVDGPVDSHSLHRSMGLMFERHRIMRTTIIENEGQLYQKVHDDLEVENAFVDLSSLSVTEGEQRIKMDLQAALYKPFDFSRESFFRMTLYRISSTKHFFILSAHHIGFDGWSLDVFMNDLAGIYQQVKSGVQQEFSKPLDYMDYTLWQQARLQNGELNRQRDYWLKQLQQNVDAPFIPRETQSFAHGNRISNVASLPIEQVKGQSLLELTRMTGGTVYTSLLAAINIWLSLLTDQTIITVGSTLSGRTQTDLEGIIGPLINPVAMRTDLSGNPTVLEMMNRTRETAYGAYENQEYPYNLVVEDQLAATGDKKSLYSLVFIGQHVSNNQPESDEMTFTECPLRRFLDETIIKAYEGSHFVQDDQLDMMLFLSTRHDQLTLTAHYNTEAFSENAMDTLLDQLKHVICQMIDNPMQRLSQINLVEEYDFNELFS